MFAGWIADGSGILVTTRAGSVAQVHRLDRAGGVPEQLTTGDEPVAGIAVHPLRNGFVYASDLGGSESYQLYWYDLETREVRLLTDGRSRNSDPLFSADGRLLAYSSTRRNGTDTDLRLLDIASGESRALIENGGNWRAIEFTPDARNLLALRRLSLERSEARSVDVVSGEQSVVQDPHRRITFDAFLYAPARKGAYYVSNRAHDRRELHYRSFAGKRVRRLSAHVPWDVTEFTLSRDGRRIAFVANEEGFGTLHLIDTATSAEIALPAFPRGIVISPDFSPDGTRLAFTLNSAQSPSEVHVINIAAQTIERWTKHADEESASLQFTSPQLVRFRTFDRVGMRRRTIPTLYYRPASATTGSPVPVVIDIHGGPAAQARPAFNAEIQFLVNELGVAVLMPNVRGSSGYGSSYRDLDNGMRREDAVRDIGALLDWIAAQPELDASRVGVRGVSYGGYMALATMIHYGDRLRAGVSVAGISNFVTFLSETGSYRRDQRRLEYGDERETRMRGFLERISPLTRAERIRSPLLVAHGVNDPRVPVGEADQLVRSVRERGGDVWYLRFDDEGHGFRKTANADRYTALQMLFWQRHLLMSTE